MTKQHDGGLLDGDVDLSLLSIEGLEQRSYRLTDLRREVRTQALAVQAALGNAVEQQRISKLLGREVMVISAKGLDSGETIGTAKSR